jgi:hypothetical protein
LACLPEPEDIDHARSTHDRHPPLEVDPEEREMLQQEVHGVSVPALSLRSPSVHLKGPELITGARQRPFPPPPPEASLRLGRTAYLQGTGFWLQLGHTGGMKRPRTRRGPISGLCPRHPRTDAKGTLSGFQPRLRSAAAALPWRFATARDDDFFDQLASRRLAAPRSTKRNRASDEIGTKHITRNVIVSARS